MVKLFNLDTNRFISKEKKLRQTIKKSLNKTMWGRYSPKDLLLLNAKFQWQWVSLFFLKYYFFWKSLFLIPSMLFKSFWMYELYKRAQLKDSKRSLIKATANLSQNANESPTVLQQERKQVGFRCGSCWLKHPHSHKMTPSDSELKISFFDSGSSS